MQKFNFNLSKKVQFLKVESGIVFKLNNYSDCLDFIDIACPGEILILNEDDSFYSFDSVIKVLDSESIDLPVVYQQQIKRVEFLGSIKCLNSALLKVVNFFLIASTKPELLKLNNRLISSVLNLNRETVSRKLTWLRNKEIIFCSKKDQNRKQNPIKIINLTKLNDSLNQLR